MADYIIMLGIIVAYIVGFAIGYFYAKRKRGGTIPMPSSFLKPKVKHTVLGVYSQKVSEAEILEVLEKLETRREIMKGASF